MNPSLISVSLPAQTGHSLGIVNRSIKELISEGYLDEEIRPTEKALREAKEKAPKNAIILAAGFGMRMVRLILRHQRTSRNQRRAAD